MRNIMIFILAAISSFSAGAAKYSYTFNNVPVSEAILRLCKENPELNISFIYKELDNYRTSAKINTDDAYDALRNIIGLNPISVLNKENNYYVEALQHGRFRYTGNLVGTDRQPVVAATVMLLSPKDSTVLTYGISDEAGRFTIPCDKEGVIAKVTCLGYKPTYKRCASFNIGTIHLAELPVRLKTVKIEVDNAAFLSDKSIYIPTLRQKNASQTAYDLLARMAIPQLFTQLGSSSVSTSSGQPVSIYIDYVPASSDDFKMMNMSDVKSVEYLENSSDPRFRGERNVINFRMTRYEYGGYLKALGTENFISNTGFAQANARFVKKKMTYDIMGYGYYRHNDHFGVDQTETFHLPQDDGSIKSFNRESLTESSKNSKYNYETSARALYTDNNITANSLFTFGIDDTPHNDNIGTVKYTDDLIEQSKYESLEESKAKYLKYNGYYFFSLPYNSSLMTTAIYSYSHTKQASRYSEIKLTPIYNAANDNTHTGYLELDYNRTFSDRHSIKALARGIYEHNRTNYSGSVNALDIATTRYCLVGASYSFSGAKVRASLGFGWNWMVTRLNENKTYTNFPYTDASFRFIPNKKNALGMVFHYSVWPPSSNYKSGNIIQVSPFMWHTGNPSLKSHRSYDFGIDYSYIPSNKFRMTVYASSWITGNRAAFVYEANADGIIRTIQQPIGSFCHYNYGINASFYLMDGKLSVSGRLEQLYVHNGMPYNVNHSYISYYLQTLYYLGKFNFALSYRSSNATDNYDPMSGIWTRNKDNFIIQAGWSNSSWNIRVTAQNLQRWNWRSYQDTMTSDYYSVNKWISNSSSHALIQLSATYTFGFGKKVKRGNDISKQSGASSGILK